MRDIARFLSGFKEFQKTYFCAENEYFADLQSGQNPKALVVACCDSRVDPALIMGCAPGDIFVVRNVGNLVPPYEKADGRHGVSAALEYAVKYLSIEHIIVCGHSHCGGIQALMSPETDDLGEFIGPWVHIANQALKDVKEKFADKPPKVRQRACEMAAVLVSMENLLTFPWIAEPVQTRELFLHGWYFDMESGELFSYLPETKSFELIVPRCGIPSGDKGQP